MALSALTSETELTLPAKYVFKNDLELSVQKAGEEFQRKQQQYKIWPHGLETVTGKCYVKESCPELSDQLGDWICVLLHGRSFLGCKCEMLPADIQAITNSEVFQEQELNMLISWF